MSKRIFVVTGANKGIGYGIVKGLAEKVNGALIYLTARNPSLGQDSLAKLKSELGDKSRSEVAYHQLDITDEESCERLASHLKQQHSGIDVLVNNAGFAFNHDATEPAEQQAEVTIGINYYGTKTASKHLVPLIRDGGRLVNVCSTMGVMKGRYSDALINKFRGGNYTEKDIDHFAEEYKKYAKEGTRKENGYPESAYCVSKASEIAYTLLQHEQLKGKGIVVNACCPGFVDTDMTNHKGTKTIEEGADTPIYLAIGADAPQGKFVRDRSVMEWF